jgi:hypothetical protein
MTWQRDETPEKRYTGDRYNVYLVEHGDCWETGIVDDEGEKDMTVIHQEYEMAEERYEQLIETADWDRMPRFPGREEERLTDG